MRRPSGKPSAGKFIKMKETARFLRRKHAVSPLFSHLTQPVYIRLKRAQHFCRRAVIAKQVFPLRLYRTYGRFSRKIEFHKEAAIRIPRI